MNVQGFENDAEYLNDVVDWLRLRATQMTVLQELRDAERENQTGGDNRRGQHVQQLRCRAVLAREAEEMAHDEMAVRLDAHRVSDRPLLGIDVLAEQHRLNEEERLILLVALLPAISQTLAEDVLGGVGSFYASVSVSDLIRILDPQGPGDWIAARRYFLPEAPLVKGRLLGIDSHREDDERPDSLLTSDVTVSMETFHILTGTADEDAS